MAITVKCARRVCTCEALVDLARHSEHFLVRREALGELSDRCLSQRRHTVGHRSFEDLFAVLGLVDQPADLGADVEHLEDSGASVEAGVPTPNTPLADFHREAALLARLNRDPECVDLLLVERRLGPALAADLPHQAL